MRNILDDKIQTIANSLTQGNEEKEKAQLALSALKNELHRFESTLAEKTADLESRIAASQALQRKQLSDLISDREKHHKITLDNERTKSVEILKKELTQAVMHELDDDDEDGGDVSDCDDVKDKRE